MSSPGRRVSGAFGGFRHASKRLILSYIVDWIIIIGTAAIGGLFHYLKGNRRPFDLRDRTISFPMHEDTVSGLVLVIISLIAPGFIIFWVSLLFVPGPTVPKDTPKSLIWRRKIWEINTGWMGLGVSLAGAFMVTEGLKKLYGKPRPDLLSRCDPDLENMTQFIVGGLSQTLSDAPIMVSYKICRQPDIAILRDGFASFPSGHSSFSFAGLLYLAFYLASKFSVYIPYLAVTSTTDAYYSSHFSNYHRSRTTGSQSGESEPSSSIPLRNRSAAPPLPALILVFLPIGTCLFVTASRFFNNRHHGFDIISGSVIGIFFAWFGFRWYHLPIRQGSGWSWGARTRDRGFWTGVGTGGWVGQEGWGGNDSASDLESHGTDDMLGPGRQDKAELAQQHQQFRTPNGPVGGAAHAPGNYEMKYVPDSRGGPPGVHDRSSSGTASEWQAV